MDWRISACLPLYSFSFLSYISAVIPLCFLDYESFNPAIPLFEGFKPYQHIAFQYSLHILTQDGQLSHYDYLAREQGNPLPELLSSMASHVPATGSVIVWNKSFEMSRNEEMARLMPQYASFLQHVNARVFDLMEIFKKQHYVHPAFKGSCSIKKVLPVLVPSLSYKDLVIQEGGSASVTWYKMLTEMPPDAKEETCNHMLPYCELDTLAMVEVYRQLHSLAA